VRLFRRLMPEVRFTWILAGVRSARVGEGLSLEVAAARPRLRQYVLAKVGQAVPPANFAGR
jgi:hypothetical protein